jgi:phage recombination protein Bet
MSAAQNLPAVRLPYNASAVAAYGVDANQWKVLAEAIFPLAKSAESIAMALAYCKARNLDVMKKPVHIVPMWSSEKRTYVETIWPGISEIRTTAFRTKQYAGADAMVTGDFVEKTFEGMVGKDNRHVKLSVRFPEWGQITVWRLVDGVRVPFVGPKVYWLEAYARQGKSDIPNEMWSKRPVGQLEKCAEAAALRRAFPEEIGSEYAAEEMEGHALPSTGVLLEGEVVEPPTPPQVQQQGLKPATATVTSGRTSQPYTDMGGNPAQQQEWTEDGEQQDPSARWEKLLVDLKAELSRCESLGHVDTTVSNFSVDVKQAPDDVRRKAIALVKQRQETIREEIQRQQEEASRSPAASDDDAGRASSSGAEGGPAENGSIPTPRYFHHPESEALMMTTDGSHPGTDGLVEEIDETRYRVLEAMRSGQQSEAAPEPPAPPADPKLEELLADARTAAMEGKVALRRHFNGLAAEDRDLLRPHDNALYAAAEAAENPPKTGE